MEISVTTVADGKTRVRIYNPAPGFLTWQRFRLHPPDGANPIYSAESSGFDSLEWVFYIEDYAGRFITPYPNQNHGTFDVVVEKQGLVGDWSDQDKATGVQYSINSNELTRPSITDVKYSPSQRLLDSDIYVKGRNGITVSSMDATGKYGATVVAKKWQVEGIAYSVENTSAALKSYGQIPITFTVTDSRGFSVSRTEYITVYDYYKPYISPTIENDRVIAERTDTSGEIVDGGANLRVAAGKRYATVGGLNKCSLKYRIKAANEEWTVYNYVLEEDSALNDYSDNLPITLDTHKLYKLELVVIDRFGEGESMMFDLLTDEVYMYRSGTRKSIAFGGHVTKDNAFEVYWGAHFYGGVVIDPIDGTSGIVISSSTPESNKKFLLTINDSGTISATEY